MSDWDIHEYGRWIERAKRHIRRSRIPAVNKRLILEFDRSLLVEGLSVPRRAKLLRHMVDIAKEFLPVRFDGATKKHLLEAVARIEGREGYSAHTKRDVKIALRKFFKWHAYGEDAVNREGYPDLVAWIKPKVRKKDLPVVQATDLITHEEVETMIRACRHPRNRAFLAVLYELGARIGEVGNLRVGDVTRDDYSILVGLDGKTGKRTVRVVMYAGHLVTWLNLHPQADDPGAPLWPSLRSRSFLQPLPYHEFRNWIKRAAKEAGIRKRVYPHLFRHSRVTHLLAAGKLNDAQAKVFFGWVPESKELSIYSHLVTKDANDAILRMYGVQKEAGGPKLDATQCGMCEMANPPSSKFCYRCGFALRDTDLEKVKARREEAERLLDQFLQKPEVRELFKKMVRDEKGNDGNGAAPPPASPGPPGPSGGAGSSARRAA